MLRIAHISDLHIRDESVNNDQLSLVHTTAKIILKALGIHVEAGGHDPNKLLALSARLKALRPDVIVVTGDITNFGDEPSFKKAGEFLTQLKLDTGAQRILCVPGNHDCLIERAALAKQQNGAKTRALLWLIGKLNRETEVIQEGASHQFFETEWAPASAAKILENYEKFCEKYGLGTCDPSQPVVFSAGWGNVGIFPFNSVNGPGLMANKGEIGKTQFVKFGNFCKEQSAKDLEMSVRIALLHHHPISAPQSLDSEVNRAYDWMDDGPRLLNVLNAHKFNFVLHGHQHQPFTCSVDYGKGKSFQTLIVAAGSASQGIGENPENSFNLIDLITPFEARVQRFKYGDTGFETVPEMSRVFPLTRLEDIRLGDSTDEETVEDWALQGLVRNSFRDFDHMGEAFEYEELSFDVTITSDHLYKARYRRKGVLRSAIGERGPIFVITGSPAMDVKDLDLKATDFIGEEAELGTPAILHDKPNSKVVQVRPRIALSVGDRFDVELSFVWKANANEPNHFDAVSLMGFRYPVKRLEYKVCVPRMANQVQLQSISSVMSHIADVTPTKERMGEDLWKYGFEINEPPPVAYLFRFSP